MCVVSDSEGNQSGLLGLPVSTSCILIAGSVTLYSILVDLLLTEADAISVVLGDNALFNIT